MNLILRSAACTLARSSHRLVGALAATLATVLLAGCGGGSGSSEAGAATQAVPLAAPAVLERGTLLQTGWATYPRLVRLSHQADARRNGRIVASVTEAVGARWQAGFHVSTDDGASFSRLGALVDTDFAKGICCGTLFELPQAVGTLAAGTLLYSASVGHDVAGTLMENRIYRSDDGGASFTRIDGATCGRSSVPRVPNAGGSGIWEPEFLVAADGSLACLFSDETEPGRSQVIKLTSTSDGVAWSAPVLVVAGTASANRPGMAGVRRLPNGRYVMSFETCSTTLLDCAAHLKWSDDGLHWGAADDLGSVPQTAAGQFFRHTPTLAFTRTASAPAGELLLIGQIAAQANGAVDTTNNGRAMFANASADGSGPWRLLASPIALPSAPLQSNWCQNYSTPMLPSADGLTLLLMQTDSTADGGCAARFGRGSLG